MIRWGMVLRYGFVVWLVPFLVAFAGFPLKERWRSLFVSIMPVTVSVVVVFSTLQCLRPTAGMSWQKGLRLGCIWWAISVLIDLPLMLSPPINYTLVEYAADIGLTYVLIPVITVGMALASQQQTSSLTTNVV